MPTRRNILTASIALAGVACAPSTITKLSKPLTFVLVHGTWHGGWVWKDVRNILEDRGHRVFTPTLTGCGEREHLSAPDVGLHTHIQDITNVIKFEELDDVILVSHAFSGLAATGALDSLKDKVSHICFFDALVPTDEVLTCVPRTPEGNYPDWYKARRAKYIDGYKMVFWEDYPIDMLLPSDHPQADRVRRLLTTHPAKSWTDELVLKNGGWEGVSRSFIHCIGQVHSKSSERMVGPARGEGWKFNEMDIARNGMLTDPLAVADMFEQGLL